MTTKLFASLMMLVSLSGCAVARGDFIPLNAGTSFRARGAEAPVVLSVGDLDRPYQEIGVIHVSGVTRQGYQQLNEKMRDKARQVGADAIIFVHYGTENVMSVVPFFVAFPYDVLTADGLAVKSLDERAAFPATVRAAAESQTDGRVDQSLHVQPQQEPRFPIRPSGRGGGGGGG